MSSKACVYVLGGSNTAALFDFNGVCILEGGFAEKKEGFMASVNELEATVLSAPTRRNVGTTAALLKQGKSFPVIMAVKPLKNVQPESSGEIVKSIQEANSKLISTKPIYFDPKYGSHIIHKSKKGILLLYLLAGDERDAEVITKALASGNEANVERAAREHGRVAVLLWRPLDVNEKAVRVLITGTCSISRIQQSLDNAAKHLSFLLHPSMKSIDTVVPYPIRRAVPSSTRYSLGNQSTTTNGTKPRFSVPMSRQSISTPTTRKPSSISTVGSARSATKSTDGSVSKTNTPTSTRIVKTISGKSSLETKGTMKSQEPAVSTNKKPVKDVINKEDQSEKPDGKSKKQTSKEVTSLKSDAPTITTVKDSLSTPSQAAKLSVKVIAVNSSSDSPPQNNPVANPCAIDDSFLSPERPGREDHLVHVYGPQPSLLTIIKSGAEKTAHISSHPGLSEVAKLISKSEESGKTTDSREQIVKNLLNLFPIKDNDENAQQQEQLRRSKSPFNASAVNNSDDATSAQNVEKENPMNNLMKHSSTLYMPSTPGSSAAKSLKFARPYYFDVVTVPRNDKLEVSVTADGLKEFISKVRSRNVILPTKNISDKHLHSLLIGKQTWCDRDYPCTIIPTHESSALLNFLQKNEDLTTNYLTFTVPVEKQRTDLISATGQIEYEFVKILL